MMDCAQYRRSILADPHDPNPDLKIHRDGCPECPPYTDRLLRFEGRLERAMRMNIPDAGDARVVPLRVPAAGASSRALSMRRGWLAMAAGMLIASWWRAACGLRLRARVWLRTSYTAGEPQAWAGTDVPAPPYGITAEVGSLFLQSRGPCFRSLTSAPPWSRRNPFGSSL